MKKKSISFDAKRPHRDGMTLFPRNKFYARPNNLVSLIIAQNQRIQTNIHGTQYTPSCSAFISFQIIFRCEFSTECLKMQFIIIS